MIRLFFSCVVLIGMTSMSWGQSAHKDLRAGDKLYDQSEFEQAEDKYRTAAIIEPSAKAKYNLGNSLFNQGRYKEAAEEFQQAINLSNDTMFRAKALYNMGNSLLKDGDLKSSLQAYKQSLLMNPQDEEAKHNYMRALQLQQQQQEQEKQDQNENQDGEEQNQDSPPPPSEEEQQENEPQDQESEEQESPQPAEPSDKKMTREEAKQLLEIIDNTDSYVQKKLKQQKSGKKKPEKEW